MTKKLPRVVAVHDVSGYGKCALTVAMPVLSVCGVEVCPLPTALLSTNTLFKGFTFLDFTPHMQSYLDHWKSLGLTFDCVYSGFLGSDEQIGYVLRLMRDFSSGMSVIDPVMGDNGVVISTYTPQMCRSMVGLVAAADCATPNVTEACLLTGRRYLSAELSPEESEAICREICAMGTKSVVLTGVQRGEMLFNCGLDSEGYFELPIDRLPYNQHGTGDVFTSVMVGGLMRGFDLRCSVDSAAHFVYDAMKYGHDNEVEDLFDRGVAFEPLAWRLGSGIYK